MTDLYQAIKTITDQKIKAHKSPTYALELEVRRLYSGDFFQAQVKTLITVGLIRQGRTINQNYYQILNP